MLMLVTYRAEEHLLKKNREASIVSSKEKGLEVNADKTKYMIISRDQNAGQSQNINIDNSTFERVEEFKYLGTNLTNQNSLQEEITSKFKSGMFAIFQCRNICLSVCYPQT